MEFNPFVEGDDGTTIENVDVRAYPPGVNVPPGVSVEQNIQAGEAHRLNPVWFYEQVHQGGPMDYKQQDLKRYENFGNFNYGATGAAAGYPDYVLHTMAGAYQLMTGPKLSEGIPFIKPPYGDQSTDYDRITQGADYYRSRK